MNKLPDTVTYGQKYDPAMKITTQEEADEYFEILVEHTMRIREGGCTREEAESIERANLGYIAGYYDDEVRERVERLFNCAHPVFGKISENGRPTAEQAFQAGRDWIAKE